MSLVSSSMNYHGPWMHILISTYILIYETYIDRVVHLHSTVLSQYTWRIYESTVPLFLILSVVMKVTAL